jgi:hypothetical protein
VVFFHEGEGTEGQAVEFTASVNPPRTEITITPVNNLKTNTKYTLGLDPLMGVDGDVSDPVMISFTTAIFFSSDNSFADQKIKIYPQPARELLHVELSGLNSTDNNLVIIDLSGKIVLEQKMVNEIMQIDISNLKGGIYLIEVMGNNFILKDKLIIKK